MSGDEDSGTPPTSAKSKGSYAETLYTYYYNGLASVSSAIAGDQKLLDSVDCWVMGKKYNGIGTTAWASDEVRRVPYFTYRNKLAVSLSNGGTHDAGWGCMIRTGQMMLCEVMKRLFLSPGGMTKLIPPAEPTSSSTRPRSGAVALSDSARRLEAEKATMDPPDLVYSWFFDTPEAPFGLHRITECGTRFGVPVGTWFSPSVTCKVFEELCNRGGHEPVQNHMTVVNALDQAVYRDVLLKEVCVENKSVLLLVPVMLGIGTVSKQYLPVIHKMLEMKTCVGIVGGKPKQSLFFVGHQQDQLFYLDPHVVQPAFASKKTLGELGGRRGTCATSSIDPCMLLCFFFEDDDDVISWEEDMRIINSMPEFPIVMIQFRTPAQIAAAEKKSKSSIPDPQPMVEDCRFDDDDDLL